VAKSGRQKPAYVHRQRSAILYDCAAFRGPFQPLGREQSFQRGAIRLRGPASEILNEVSPQPYSDYNGQRPAKPGQRSFITGHAGDRSC